MTVDIKTTIEPTFRTEPDDAGKLYPSKAKIIAEEILREKLENKSADDVEFECVVFIVVRRDRPHRCQALDQADGRWRRDRRGGVLQLRICDQRRCLFGRDEVPVEDLLVEDR